MTSEVNERAPSWVTRIVLPEIAELKGEIAGLRAELKSTNSRLEGTYARIDSINDSLNSKINCLSASTNARIDGLSNEIKEVDKRLTVKPDEMDKRLSSGIRDQKKSVNVMQRIAVLEVQVKELRKECCEFLSFLHQFLG